MARGRMLNKTVSRSRQLDLLPDDTCRLLATWTIAHLDVNGVFYADPVMVRSLVFSRRTDITEEQMTDYLRAMQDVGLIVVFQANGDQWQYWPGFHRNQIGLRVDRERPAFPPPPASLAEQGSDVAGQIPDSGGIDDGKQPAEKKLSEEKLSEQNTNGADAPPTNLESWQEYIRSEKNRPAALMRMLTTLYPKHDAVEFGFIGKTAKTVGGAGRLASLLWQAQCYHPDGDVLRYCMGMAKSKTRVPPPSRHDLSKAAAQELLQEIDDGDT